MEHSSSIAELPRPASTELGHLGGIRWGSTAAASGTHTPDCEVCTLSAVLVLAHSLPPAGVFDAGRVRRTAAKKNRGVFGVV